MVTFWGVIDVDCVKLTGLITHHKGLGLQAIGLSKPHDILHLFSVNCINNWCNSCCQKRSNLSRLNDYYFSRNKPYRNHNTLNLLDLGQVPSLLFTRDICEVLACVFFCMSLYQCTFFPRFFYLELGYFVTYLSSLSLSLISFTILYGVCKISSR